MICYLDPGETTGWATWDMGIFDSGQLDFQSIGSFMDAKTFQFGALMSVGWEAFLITAHTARKPGSHWAIEVIGVARHYALQRRCHILPSYPSSSLPTSTVRDRQLKRLGWHTPGKDHANDAACHLMHHLVHTRHLPDELVGKLVDGKANPAVH